MYARRAAKHTGCMCTGRRLRVAAAGTMLECWYVYRVFGETFYPGTRSLDGGAHMRDCILERFNVPVVCKHVFSVTLRLLQLQTERTPVLNLICTSQHLLSAKVMQKTLSCSHRSCQTVEVTLCAARYQLDTHCAGTAAAHHSQPSCSGRQGLLCHDCSVTGGVAQLLRGFKASLQAREGCSLRFIGAVSCISALHTVGSPRVLQYAYTPHACYHETNSNCPA